MATPTTSLAMTGTDADPRERRQSQHAHSRAALLKPLDELVTKEWLAALRGE